MEIKFFGQPFHDDRRLGSLLEKALPHAHLFWALSAWAQVSGLRSLGPHLRRFPLRHARSELVLGIDGGVATREALELAIELFDIVDVFHDLDTRTYHPKIYCVECEDEALVVVGSSNLTEGGLYRNYEGNVFLRLRQGNIRDVRVLKELRAYRDQLRAEGMPCRRLDRDLIEQLSASGALIRVEDQRSEDLARRKREELTSRAIFGKRTIRLPSAPRVAKPHVAREATFKLIPSSRRRGSTVPERPLLTWWKQLTRSDAIRKDARSHQRNYVILGKSGFDIDQKTWFRKIFFDQVMWRRERMRTGQIKESAEVSFEVFVGSDCLGTYELRIDHAPNRIAGQNNSPTWLNWSLLLPVILQKDFTSWYLVLEKHKSLYRLKLSRARPSPA